MNTMFCFLSGPIYDDVADAWQEGREAYENGYAASIDSNPFPLFSSAHDAWYRGFNQAKANHMNKLNNVMNRGV